jgi:large repetitive protein
VLAGLLATAVLGAPLVLGTAAHAAEATVTFSDTLPMRTTDWQRNITIARFNPALGELRSVDLTINARVDGTVGVENLAGVAASLTTRLSATVAVARPGATGTTIGSAQPAVHRTDDLAAFDGTVDHAGASGETASVTASLTSTTTLTAPTDLTLFTGSGSIVLPSNGTGTSVPPGTSDVDVDLSTSVGAEVTVVYTYVSDTRPPDPPTILSSPPAYTANPAPVITFSAETGAMTECRLTRPTESGSWAACTSPWLGNLGSSDDGLYTFGVRATDAAGNVSAETTSSFTLDRVAPAQPVLTFEPPSLGRSAQPTWAFTIEIGSTARCSLDGSAPAPCSSPFTPDLTLAPDGLHTFSVFAVDAAWNTSAPLTDTYTLDREAPAPPVITMAPASPGNDPTPTWGIELAAGAAAASCSIDGAAYAACGSWFTADLSTAADGLHTISVRNADLAGNQSLATTGTYLLDRWAPGTPTITSPSTPSNVTAPTWGIASDAGTTTECRLDAGAWLTCNGSFTTTFGPGSDGVHVLTVRATDAAGNRGPEATTTYTLDTTPPSAPVIATAPANPSNSPTPIWTFTVDADSTATCSLDGGPWIACASPYEVDLSSAPDGRHELAVRATDGVGNVGASALSSFTLDRDAPEAPSITSAPSSPGSSATVSWSFTTPEGTTTRCRIDGGSSRPCAGSMEVTFLADGLHRFTVFAVDPAGNRSASTMATYTLDRVAPVPPTITGSPASPDRVTTPQWTFVVETGSAGECSIDGAAWMPCTTTFSADLSSAPDGLHTFAVRSVDDAGNVGATATGAFVLDRTPPGAPVVTSGPAANSGDDTPTWTFVVDDDAEAWCRVDDGPWAPCAGSFTADLTADADGIHALEVRAVDAVGNEGPATVATFELDRVAPEAATLTTVPLSPGNDPSPEWWFTYEPGTTAWCSLDGAAATLCDGTVAAELPVDGVYQLAVVVVDAAGNTSDVTTSAYELDTAAPAAPLLTSPRTPDRDAHPEWEIAVELGAVAECSFDGGEPVACGTVFTVDLVGLDGHHQLAVLARDAAGNVSVLVTSAYVLDTIAPAAPVILHTPDRAAWTWRFSVEDDAIAECSVDGGPWSPCASPHPGGASGRTVRLEVRAVDRAGNRSSITRTTVTPTMAPAVAAPPSAPPPPPPIPVPSGSTDTPSLIAVAVAEPGGVTRPPLSTLAPRGQAGAELVSDVMLRRFRPEEGPFAGPVRELLQAAAETTTIPVLVILVVIAFVAVQNRIDRRDPKLVAAPLRNEPEYMEFD